MRHRLQVLQLWILFKLLVDNARTTTPPSPPQFEGKISLQGGILFVRLIKEKEIFTLVKE